MISGDRSVLAGKKGAFWYTLEELAKHWERIDIICPRSQLTAHSSQPFANVFFHPSPHGLWYHPFWIRRKGSELLKAFCHGSVTIHDYPPFYNGFGARMLLKDFPGVRSVLEIHHVVGYPSPASLNERIGRVLSRAVLPSHVRHFSAVRTVSSSVAGTLVSLGVPQEKIAVVPSFYLDRKSLTPDPSVPKEFDVVCIARLVPNKNIPLLLNALSRLPSATALISGDGPDRPKLERLVRSYGLQLRVHFSGWLKDQAAVVRTLQSGRMVAITSLSEGGPRVALEAMALGLPVIATRVGVLPDVIREGENGFLIPSDPEALALVIERLRSDEALRKHIGTMARSILDRFERGTLVRQYAEFLRQLPHP
jgi:glycosyltransferase involved in cell wall biosynthesis